MSPMSLHSRLPVAAVAALGLTLGACSSSPSTAGGSSSSGPKPAAVVLLKYVSFVPARVTIHAGQTVEWKWEDEPVGHNITFRTFSTPTQDTGTYFHTFDTPGTYPYRCTVHQTMTATVVVLP